MREDLTHSGIYLLFVQAVFQDGSIGCKENNPQVIRRATNLFDRKSLAIHPASTIFGLFTAEQCAEMSVPDTTVRLSIGLEDGEDLLADIKKSLVRE